MFLKKNIFKAKKKKFYVNYTKSEFTNLKMDFIGTCVVLRRLEA